MIDGVDLAAAAQVVAAARRRRRRVAVRMAKRVFCGAVKRLVFVLKVWRFALSIAQSARLHSPHRAPTWSRRAAASGCGDDHARGRRRARD